MAKGDSEEKELTLEEKLDAREIQLILIDYYARRYDTKNAGRLTPKKALKKISEIAKMPPFDPAPAKTIVSNVMDPIEKEVVVQLRQLGILGRSN